MNNSSELDRIVSYLLLKLRFVSDISLFHGKMGGVLFFYEYAKHVQDDVYEKFAEDILDDFYNDIKLPMPLNIENGLCGIGWGIEYLIQHRFIDADADEILEDVDNHIISCPLDRMNDFSFEKGLWGIMFYIIMRIKTPSRINKTRFDNHYIRSIRDLLLKKRNVMQHNAFCYSIMKNLEYCLGAEQPNSDTTHLPMINDFCNESRYVNMLELHSLPIGMHDGLIGVAWRSMLNCN